jgi:DNA-binding CsgD family transcriptional regulator
MELEATAATAGRLHSSTCARSARRLARFAGRVTGDTPAERLLLANLAWGCLLEGGSAAEAGEMTERALLGGLFEEQTSTSPIFYDALYVLIIAEKFALAERYCEAGLVDARERGSAIGFGVVSFLGSHLIYRLGSVVRAENHARAALAVRGQGGFPFTNMALAFLIEALIERGELSAAAVALEQDGSADIPDRFLDNCLLYSRAKLRLARGEVDLGLADLTEFGCREERWRGRNPSAFPYRSDAALALNALGEHAEARRLANEELALARAWGTPRAIGMALRALGLVEGGQRGIELLEEAVTVLQPSPARLERARVFTDLGAALRRAGYRKEAREPLRRGLGLAQECGAGPLEERAGDELAASGGRARSAVRTRLQTLTASEQRIAELAAQGLPNRDIAQTLFLSLKTVEMHLSHTYRKLGIGSRNELASTLRAVDPATITGSSPGSPP